MRALTLSLFFLTVAAVAAQTPASPLPELTCPEVATALRGVVSADNRLRDWAQLNRYRAANLAVRNPDVVFIGDSITDVWQQPRFSFFPGKSYVVRGISAQTTPQMLIRFRPDVIELRPKAVLILAGTNDIAGNTGPMTNEEIQGNFASMSELAHANGIKVIFASITPVSNYHVANNNPQTSQRPVARILAINSWMKKYAEDHGDIYLDYYSAMIDGNGLMKTELTADDLHPNAAGYAIMAPLAEAAIQRALR
jgi:lysophospholipase L1-like esterase